MSKEELKEIVYPVIGACQDTAEVLVECKAVDRLVDAHRQQLWNYMRLSKVYVGVVYNFGPVYAQCERYYYDAGQGKMVAF